MNLSKLFCLTCLSLFVAVEITATLQAQDSSGARAFIDARGALGDGTTMNTKAIQATIDSLAATGGGTVIIPKGEFLSGALFLKPGVNLELLEGAILKGSTNFGDYPTLPNARFEGHFQERVAALLNVEKSDHFRLTGPGKIDGNGAAYWKTPSPLGRPRLCAIRDSRDVVVSGVKFYNSPSWNLHLYNCQDSVVENCRFEIDRGAPGPSTDGVDVDSSQNIVVKGCFFSVNDDCVCLKGNRYDGLDQEPKSPPVRNVRVENCTFVRGHGALTLGTEAQSISDVEMKDCVVSGNMPMLRIKLRPDTANQDYRNVRVHDIRLEGTQGEIVRVSPKHGTKVPPLSAPISRVSDIVVENISGEFGAFGTLFGDATATVSNVTLRNIQVKLAKSAELNTNGVAALKIENVSVELVTALPPQANAENNLDITLAGAVGDGVTLNTKSIQSAIDKLAADGGGTLVVPKGVFLSGAIFLKPGVNLHLDASAVLKGSSDTKDYPRMRTRIEGHFEEWLPAFINADKSDHLRITGSGTLDGNGAPFWQAFWDQRKINPDVANLDVPRPRLMLIGNSTDVQISGIIFKDAGFWNLHLYRCKNVLVENVRFEIPKGAKCPSTDGTDIDSCQNVTIRGCTYRVDDDSVCLKGSKGPFALDDKDSPPVEHIRVENCTFERGHGVVTLGSEATIVRDVVVENCRVVGPINLVRFKLRADTPQTYEDIHYHNITLDSTGTIFQVKPWAQYFDLKGQTPPKSVVRNLTLSDIKGRYGSFGTIEGNRGQTEISDITLENIAVQLTNETLKSDTVKNLKVENVTVNGKPFVPSL